MARHAIERGELRRLDLESALLCRTGSEPPMQELPLMRAWVFTKDELQRALRQEPPEFAASLEAAMTLAGSLQWTPLYWCFNEAQLQADWPQWRSRSDIGADQARAMVEWLYTAAALRLRVFELEPGA